MRPLIIFGNIFALTVCANDLLRSSKSKSCKCFPGDACWPTEQEWTKFNATVGGRLIKTVPLGSPCHDPHYNDRLCEQLKSSWKKAPVHIDSSSSTQAAIFANASCDPFTPRSTPCQLGNYVRYAVNATEPNHISATVRFANHNNIRLVIRNTGHDYMGRSTGASGLAVWTHHLKGVQVKEWSDDEYTGKAVKIGAGVQGFEISEAAHAAGLVVVTGECPTVGVGGGYTMSGGHSPLSTAFGLSADNTLEFQVVTADGRLVTASPSSPHHADLFWALSGSGSGNYGVVVSVTLKAHPDRATSGASFTIDKPGLDYSAIINAFHATLPHIVDSGTQVTYYATGNLLVVYSITGYNRTLADLETSLMPLTQSLAAMNISLKPTYTHFDSYHDHYWHYFGPLPAGHFGSAGDQLMGGRLLNRDAFPGVAPAINATMQLGSMFIGQAMNVSRFAKPKRRAVLRQWRDALIMSAYSLPYTTDVPYSDMVARQNYITSTVMPIIEKMTPGAGAYINEADFQQKDWQRVFYGENYKRLLEIKRKYDSKGLFYHRIAVGSEGWKAQEDGRICET
ncbi:6-hydroxy-D-nicotine oxidase [Metarhizium guizhouense ARSEF 977]|uniref:6-hydroxy-D-nicotine oxidase n=1 Tax=Metarhizium guizhouense (strain ARSEF 977) TaxID=1276136 RepID=A0A0B4GD73_METGA|nr:6-hydroxy-D-nicotine oxidase [Metarhizium guizhouense ARSEF 977]